jgi:hypothetical protein
MLRRLRLSALALLAAALASCDAATVRTVNYQQPNQTWQAYRLARYAGAEGPILVEMRNSPYPGPPEQAAAVIAEAAGGDVVSGTPFTGDPKAAARPDWRVVYAFNVGSPPAAAVCDKNQPAPPPPVGAWAALVVFCNGPTPIISLGAWSAALPGPDSPEFRNFGRLTLLHMFGQGGLGPFVIG